MALPMLGPLTPWQQGWKKEVNVSLHLYMWATSMSIGKEKRHKKKGEQ
jgi:hypothetical protein